MIYAAPKNCLTFEVSGRYALFTDPLTRVGGEKFSYHLPTYEALKGITESIYWKPTLTWIIDKARLMEPIRTEPKNMKPININGIYPSLRDPAKKKQEPFNTLATYTYLTKVRYQVMAHFEWNYQRKDLADDRNEGKHFNVAQRMLAKGGRRDIFLGTRECQAYVEPCKFGSGQSPHDEAGEIGYGLMFHGFDYPDSIGKPELHGRFWHAVIRNGIIDFPRPDDPKVIRRFIRDMQPKPPKSVGLHEEGLLP